METPDYQVQHEVPKIQVFSDVVDTGRSFFNLDGTSETRESYTKRTVAEMASPHHTDQQTRASQRTRRLKNKLAARKAEKEKRQMAEYRQLLYTAAHEYISNPSFDFDGPDSWREKLLSADPRPAHPGFVEKIRKRAQSFGPAGICEEQVNRSARFERQTCEMLSVLSKMIESNSRAMAKDQFDSIMQYQFEEADRRLAQTTRF